MKRCEGSHGSDELRWQLQLAVGECDLYPSWVILPGDKKSCGRVAASGECLPAFPPLPHDPLVSWLLLFAQVTCCCLHRGLNKCLLALPPLIHTSPILTHPFPPSVTPPLRATSLVSRLLLHAHRLVWVAVHLIRVSSGEVVQVSARATDRGHAVRELDAVARPEGAQRRMPANMLWGVNMGKVWWPQGE